MWLIPSTWWYRLLDSAPDQDGLAVLAATAAVYSTLSHFRARYETFVPFAAINPYFDTLRYYTIVVLSAVTAGSLAWLCTMGASSANSSPPL